MRLQKQFKCDITSTTVEIILKITKESHTMRFIHEHIHERRFESSHTKGELWSNIF